ncbi:hypothetical protein JW968_06495 [Candidatus Woesearchaeota archaeon]|nr:hypothetical protein [Candidatus Woesearchaeota archaeon]
MNKLNWLIFSLFLVVVMHHSYPQMGMVRMDPSFPGEEMAVHVNVLNPIDDDMEDATVSLWIPEADDFYYKTKGFDVPPLAKHGRYVFPEFTEEHHEMLVRIMVENDDGKTIKWMHIIPS